MRKKTAIELGVIIATAIALVFATASLLTGRKDGVPARPGSKAPAATKGAGKGLDLLRPGIKIRTMKDDNFYVKFCRIADALPLVRDPFSFSGTGPKTSRDKLDLTGILWDPQSPTAVISGSFYGVGDSTDQFTVTGIQEDKVLLKDGVGDFELRLKS